MKEENAQTESRRNLSSESTDELIGLGSVEEMTKGFSQGWKIEGGIAPWYF
jgi:hypothetical protein